MSHFFRREFTFDRIARMLVLSVLILLIYVAVQAIWSVILPFLLAGIFAYVMMPLVLPTAAVSREDLGEH